MGHSPNRSKSKEYDPSLGLVAVIVLKVETLKVDSRNLIFLLPPRTFDTAFD